MTLRGTIRAEDSDLDAGHEFQDQRSPSIASNSMKSMWGRGGLGDPSGLCFHGFLPG